MMNTAIVTGASSGIGKATAGALMDSGYRVYGFGRDFKSCNETELFRIREFDIMDTDRLVKEIKDIRKKEDISLLVNNAGTAYFGLHEELNPVKIHEMVSVNLEVPMILTQLLLRDIKKNKGAVINISSVTAKKPSPHGCCYGATKAGLTAFSESLFDEARKYGVRVITIHPDMTGTNLYRNADFDIGDTPDTYLLPKEVAEALKWAVSLREGMAVTDITLKPQYHRITKGKKRT